MTALAKNVARVLMMMGLGPERASATDQCESQDSCTFDEGKDEQLAWWMVLLFTFTVVAWTVFLWFGFNWLRQLWNEHQQLCLQVAQVDAFAGAIRTDCNELPRQVATTRRELTELEQAQEMVSDGTDAISTMAWLRWVDMSG